MAGGCRSTASTAGPASRRSATTSSWAGRSAETTRRPATADDANAHCLIYNQGIEDRLATLETEPRTPEERRQWLLARGPRQPVIVAEAVGRVVGWGSLNSFNPRPAYDHVADFSIYV